MSMRRRPVEERFWTWVYPEPNCGCWLWAGPTTRQGYGTISLGGRGGQHTGAHRLSLIIDGKTLTKDDLVLHRCDNPICVNPDHLFVGTQHDNIADMDRKGRRVSGSHKLKGKPRPGIIHNSTKTHCKYGHPFSGDNLRLYRGMRVCVTCGRLRAKHSKARKKLFIGTAK